MKIRNLIAVAVAAVFIAGMATEAYGAPRKDEKKKLTEENIRLQSRIDSLCKELDLFRIKLQQADSLNQILSRPIQDTQESETFEPDIKEYTEEENRRKYLDFNDLEELDTKVDYVFTPFTKYLDSYGISIDSAEEDI